MHPPALSIAKVSRPAIADFYSVHCPENGEGWCNCVAWWVPTWEGWGQRTAAQNRELRDQLFEQGEYDGYLFYVDGAPAGWCQTGPRDRLVKLCRQYRLDPEASVWALSCFVMIPRFRHKGYTHRFLALVLEDLARQGVSRVQAFPKRGADLEAGQVWTGPEKLYLGAGFTVERDDPKAPILAKVLSMS